MIQQFSFSGTGRQVNAAGRTFRYETGSAAGASEAIRVRADGQDLGTLLPGDSIRLGRTASLWEVAPVSAACNGVVRVGAAEFESNRLAGTVTLGDTKYGRTLQHRSFVVSQPFDNDVGDTTIRFQVWNPAVSTRALIVEKVHSSHDVVGYATALWLDQAELNTVSAQGATLPQEKGVSVSKLNGLLATNGAVQGVGVVKANSTNVKLTMFSVATLAWVMDNDAEALASPIIVMPGYGLSVMSIKQDGGVNVTRRWTRRVEWDEVNLADL